jgi:cytochrome c-type biogenesis protein
MAPIKSPLHPPLKRRVGLGLVGLAMAIGIAIWQGPMVFDPPEVIGTLFQPLETTILALENQFQPWFEQQQGIYLLPLAFVGGLIASLSPCILGLLPLNLGYIGTLELTSRRQALVKAGWFVLGVVTVLSAVGLFASAAAAIFVTFRGYVNVFVGVIILLMGASLAGWWQMPLPQNNLPVTLPITLPIKLLQAIPASYGVGLTFALVSSPCASPVLFAVLSAAAASGSPVISVLAMVSYALGYTAIIFLASLFTGLLKQSRVLLRHGDSITRLGSLVLGVAGAYYIVNGILWFFA